MRSIPFALLVALLFSARLFAVEPISGSAPPPAEASVATLSSGTVRVEKTIETIDQQQMTLGELTEYFSKLKIGTAIRLTYSNGADFAGNFEGREPGRALIYCRRGITPVRQVPLRKVVDAYIIESSTLTVRIHRTDFTWKEK